MAVSAEAFDYATPAAMMVDILRSVGYSSEVLKLQ